MGGAWSREVGCLLQGYLVPEGGGGCVVSHHALRQTPPHPL